MKGHRRVIELKCLGQWSFLYFPCLRDNINPSTFGNIKNDHELKQLKEKVRTQANLQWHMLLFHIFVKFIFLSFHKSLINNNKYVIKNYHKFSYHIINTQILR